MRRLALALLCALALPALALAGISRPDPTTLIVEEDGARIEVRAGSLGSPLGPGQAGIVRVAVTAPPTTPASVTFRTGALGDPAGRCRRPDEPDPFYDGWLVCEGRGAWSVALTIPPHHTVLAGECPLLGLVVRLSVAIGGRQVVPPSALQAPYRPCYRAVAPLVR